MFHDLPRYSDYGMSTIGWAPYLPGHWGEERGKSLFERMQREPSETDGVVTCFRDGVVTLRSRRRMTGFTESLKEIGYQGVRKGDLVIHAMDAFAGAVGVSDSDGKATPVYSICIPRRGANSHYYAAVVREMARSSWIQALSKGVRERSTDFRFEMFGTQMLPVPPAEEQAAIVKYLAHANARIDKAIIAKRRLIALLEELAAVIIDQIVSQEHVDDEITSIGQTSFLVQTGPFGSQLHADEYVMDGVPVINPAHIAESGINHDSAISVMPSKAEDLSRHRLQVGDVVLARRGDLGRSAVVSPAEEGWLCGTGSLIVRIRPDKWDSAYFRILFSSPRNKERLQLASVGSTMANLNASQISRMRLRRPALSYQKEAVARSNQERAAHAVRRAMIEREIALLQEFRTRLIADVVTGQVDIRAIAASLPDDFEVVPDLSGRFR